MEEARPSFGYLVLAKILGSTRHRVVVTTNFDSLIADALATIGMRRPLVCGHESLAGFAQRGLQRPLVAQVHRALFLAPINDTAGTAQLAPGWKEALGSLFERSLILVIGYGGNDGSLMDYLDVIPLREKGSALYWCHRHGDPLSPRVAQLLVKQRGIAVPIPGFDELMVQLAPSLLKDEWDVEAMAETIKQLGQQAAQDFRAAHDQLIQKEVPKPDKPQSPEAKADSQATLEALRKAQKGKTWWMWEMEAAAALTPDEQERIYRNALAALPKNAELAGNFATFLTDIRKNHNDAERLYRRALELNPKQVNIMGNFATFLTDIRKNHDEAEHLYNRALGLDPKHANNLSNFAAFLATIQKNHEEAERFFLRALELDPTDPDILGNYASFLLSIGKVNEAAELARRAFDLSAHSPSQATAEALMYLSLVAVLKGEDAQPALGRLKHVLNAGYPKGSWSFEFLNEALAPRLNLEEQAFYSALGEAILDEARIPTLEAFPAWSGLQEVDHRAPWP